MIDEPARPQSARKIALIATLGFAVAMLGIGGVMYAIAHRKRPAYYTMGEVRTNLKALWTHERAYYGEKDRYSERVHVGSSRVDLQACKLEYSIVSPK